MLIESLQIKAFRGIKNELNLDLSARLTLIYAPNGTGKTSICDATEWLLTGEVHRLASAARLVLAAIPAAHRGAVLGQPADPRVRAPAAGLGARLCTGDDA